MEFKKIKRGRVILAAMAASVAGGCDFNSDPAYDAYKCAKVANYMNDKVGGRNAISSLMSIMAKSEATAGSPARIAMEMNDKFQEDLQLYKYSPAGQMKIIANTYSSGKCQDLFSKTIPPNSK